MKFVWVVIALTVTLAGVGTACGPEEKYCFDEHMACSAATQAERVREEERLMEEERLRREREMMLADGGTTIIGQ